MPQEHTGEEGIRYHLSHQMLQTVAARLGMVKICSEDAERGKIKSKLCTGPKV